MEIETGKLKAALVCAPATEVRYYLNGVYIDPAGLMVSTDGHRLFVARTGEAWKGDGYIVPREAVKRALAGYKGKTIEVGPDRVGDVACQPIDGTYPDWRRVMPGDVTGAVAQFNPDYVGELGKIAKALGGAGVHVWHNGDGPAPVTFPGCDDAFVVLMPLRSKEKGDAMAIMRRIVG